MQRLNNTNISRAWYFLYFGAGVFLLPYINVSVLAANGLTAKQIGLLGALQPWVSAPASFAWSALADARRAHRSIFIGTLVASTLVHAALAAGRTFPQFLALCVLGEALGAPVTLLADAAVMAAAEDDGDYGRTRVMGAWGWGFFGACSGWAVGRFGASAIFGGYLLLMVPTVLLACLMRCDPLEGKRVTAAAANGAKAGRLRQQQQQGVQQQASDQQQQQEKGGSGAGDRQEQGKAQGQEEDENVPLLHSLDSPQPQDQDRETRNASLSPAAAPTTFGAKLALLLSAPPVLVFFAQATLMGFGIGVISAFLFIFLKALGGSELLMGLTLTATCAAEIPAFYIQGAVLRRVRASTLLHFVVGTYVLRLALYAALPVAGNPWAVLPIELLHGITFGCGWGGGTVQAKRLAERMGVEGLEATMQGIFQGLYFGVGQGLGALVGGVLFQAHGGQRMFAETALITATAWAACAAAERLAGNCCNCCPTVTQRRGRQYPVSGGGGAAGVALSQLGRSELKSKDSGPDLAHLRPSSNDTVV